MPFFIIFILIPLAEVYAFIEVGGQVGLLKTLLLCVLTAMIGGFLVRQQGLEMLMQGQRELQSGRLPLDKLFDGFCIVIAGALLVTPGFVTDFVGFSLLFPPFRSFMRRMIKKSGKFSVHGMGQSTSDYTYSNHGDDIIEGEYEQVKETQETLDHERKSR